MGIKWNSVQENSKEQTLSKRKMLQQEAMSLIIIKRNQKEKLEMI